MSEATEREKTAQIMQLVSEFGQLRWSEGGHAAKYYSRVLELADRQQDAADLYAQIETAVVALASQPVAAVGQTDEMILHLWDIHVGEPTKDMPLSDGDKIAFARAVLARSLVGVRGSGVVHSAERSGEAATAREMGDPIRELIEEHAALIEAGENYAYFELAYTRQTGWMAWLTDRPARGEPGTAAHAQSRKVIARGQGDTADEACTDALAVLGTTRVRSADNASPWSDEKTPASAP